MTGPLGGGSVGDAYVDVRANTTRFNRDLEEGVTSAGRSAEPEADQVGTNLGGRIGRGVERQVGRSGPRIARSIGTAVEREVISVRPNFRYDTRGRDGRFISQAATGIRNEVEQAFAGAAAGGGSLFNRIGQGIADAIGSGFNVSGRSPLVFILAPVYAAIAGLVVAAIQAANGIVAALTAVPAAIAVIGVEVGVLILAFKGVGTAIQEAFSAKNAEELNQAVKNLTPSAGAFVKALVPAKSLFDSLAKSAQESFFRAFGGGARVTALLDAITKPLKANVPIVADALGRFIGRLTDFFTSPLFTLFIKTIFPATAAIINSLSGPFLHLVESLFALIIKTLPFLGALSDRFGKLMENFADILDSVDPEWLTNMLNTLDATFELLGEIIGLVAVLFKQTDLAGGKGFLDFLVITVNSLKNFFASDIGKEAIAAIIRLAEASIILILGMIGALSLLLAAFQLVTNSIGTFVGWIIDLFTGAGDEAEKAKETFGRAAESVKQSFVTAIEYIKTVPDKITEALGSLGGLLVGAGRNLINGLINGIKSAVPSLKGALAWITDMLPDWKGPEDKDKKILQPAGEAVMQGFGAGIARGAADVANMLSDFTSGLGSIGVNTNTNHFVFGANSIQVGFNGALPTQAQATGAGAAVGNGIMNQLAARNTRLAVRTL